MHVVCSVGLGWECLLTSNSLCICNKVEYCCKSLSKVDCFQGKADALVKSQVASPWLKRVTETLATKTHTHTSAEGEGDEKKRGEEWSAEKIASPRRWILLPGESPFEF